MSADFLCSVLEFPCAELNVHPAWNDAKEYIKKLPERFLAKVLNDFRDFSLSEEDEPDYTFVEAVKDQEGQQDLHVLFEKALSVCEDMWNGNANGTSIMLSNTSILVCGGSSWGDPVEGMDEMGLFDVCGAASVAGFIGTSQQYKEGEDD